MAKKEIVGYGSVWERDDTFHDLCGLFRWKLLLKQAGKKIYWDLDKESGDGDSWYDGWYNLTSNIQAAAIDWPCDDDGKTIGKRILIACVTTGRGSNASWSVSGSGTASGGSSGGSAGGSLQLSYTPGYSGQKLEWIIRLEVCPGVEGCPNVKVLSNRTSVSDKEYFWGHLLYDDDDHESSVVKKHKPQIGIGDCDETVPLDESLLPINIRPLKIDTAK